MILHVHAKFDDAVDIVRWLGMGCFMSPVDIKHAFRLSPVRKDQWPLPRYLWEGVSFVATGLPWEADAVPLISPLVLLLCWVFVLVGMVEFPIQYLDGFSRQHG